MSKMFLTEYVDDLTGKPYEDGETVKFTVDGKAYEIDLNKKNAAQFRRSMAKYTEAGRTVKVHRMTRHANGVHTGVREMRQWATSHGFEVGQRGRIPHTVREAYEHRSDNS